jgi:hypothetical protein
VAIVGEWVRRSVTIDVLKSNAYYARVTVVVLERNDYRMRE